MGRREGLSRQLDASPQAQGREFERLCEELLENDAICSRYMGFAA
jgi:predicted phosphoadenosine phosphosulfate sulfurtransferase